MILRITVTTKRHVLLIGLIKMYQKTENGRGYIISIGTSRTKFNLIKMEKQYSNGSKSILFIKFSDSSKYIKI